MKKIDKKYKTSQNKRNEYIYEFANGERTIIIPGENGVTEIDIQLNHSFDDEDIRAWNRDVYKKNHYIEDFSQGSQVEHNKLLADWDANPFNKILEMENCEERQKLIEQLHKAMGQLTDKQFRTIQKKFYEQKTNVEIAAEEDVTEAAIRNRLNKIYRRLEKLIRKGS
ncbi:TPA: RNA polymerase sigma factor [Enterococcus faecalis]|nr:sigma-70 family RNA polymerase sigma factor [Enterococcus faecalis]